MVRIKYSKLATSADSMIPQVSEEFCDLRSRNRQTDLNNYNAPQPADVISLNKYYLLGIWFRIYSGFNMKF